MLYRLDREGAPYSDGAVPVYTDWIGGSTLAAVRNCRVFEAAAWNAGARDSAMRRSVRVTGEPLTVWAAPAVASVGGRKRRGELRHADDGTPAFVIYSDC